MEVWLYEIYEDIVYDRFNDPMRREARAPPLGAYFQYNTPVRVGRGG